ncbi:MAG: hypothetical protein QXV17_13020 [Candidatus Micrarchaeaceae archaeon]
MAKKRKLLRGEHRFHGRIVKPKNFKKWKADKIYNRHKKVWEKVEEAIRVEEIPVIRKITPNKKITVALYKYETGDGHGRTLELDIVGHIILTLEEFNRVESVEKLMAAFISNYLASQGYAGLSAATEYEEGKYGIEIEDTFEGPSSFEFDRFMINNEDYLNNIKKGTPNVKKHQEQKKL